MSSRSPHHLLSTVSLAALAFVAVGLSVAALSQNRIATPAIAVATTTKPQTSTAAPTTEQTVTQSQSTPTPESTPGDLVVVIIGDGNSSADTPDVWTKDASEDLGWNPVVNFSATGRGYIKKPSACDIPVCSNFMGTIDAVAAENPDVVVTFGGAADGDQDLEAAAKDYFAALREALPEAELIAISPVTSEDEAQYWLTLHSKTIRAGVEAVDGTFIDVGQPGVGDGDELSPAAQDEVAQAVIAELS